MESHWYVGNCVSKPFFEGLLQLFGREVDTRKRRTVILLLIGTDRHAEPGLCVPEDPQQIYLPP